MHPALGPDGDYTVTRFEAQPLCYPAKHLEAGPWCWESAGRVEYVAYSV